MLIYGALLSPYVRKVCVIAAEKGLPFEMKFTPRGGTDAEFLAISPAGKIPALRDGDYALADSSAIAAYLDAQYPAIGLIPAEARARGRVVWFDEYADTVLGASGLKVLFHRLVAPKLLKLPYDEAVAEQGVAELPAIYRYLESVAPADGWLVGDGFSLADIAVASMFRSLSYVHVEPKAEDWPGLAAWYSRVCARPAWQQVAEMEAAGMRR